MSDYFDRVERQIMQRVEAGVPRASRRPSVLGYLATAAAVLVVIVVAGVFLLVHSSSPTTPTTPSAPAGGHTGTGVTFTAKTIDPHARLGPALDRSVTILRERLRSDFPGIRVERIGNDVVVMPPTGGAATRARILALAAPGRLEMYDWEANVITPNGKTVASQLTAQDPTALEISQGAGSAATGEPGAGAMSRAQASAVAAKRPGSVIVQAVAPVATLGAGTGGRNARFFVVANLVPGLSGQDLTHPKAIANSAVGTPDISFGFTAAGAVAFRSLTRSVAHRGELVSSPGETLDQHFAIAIDGRLISVPYIDFKQYPDGIAPTNGADIAGGFTLQSARDLATILRYGPLPVELHAVTGAG
jgi:preprotein translocase subunit SecD